LSVESTQSSVVEQEAGVPEASATDERQPVPSALVRLLVLLGFCVFINYIDRGNLAIAAPLLKDELGINASQLGVLLSAFFWTYACLLPVYGWLVDRVNVYWLLLACFSIWSVATAATGLVRGFTALLVLRLIVGIGEAVAFPAYSKIIAVNFREEHRGFANSFIAAGLFLGPGFGVLLGGTLMSHFGWRPFFVALGLLSLLWVPPWIEWTPRKVAPTAKNASGPSLIQFVRLRAAWGTCFGLFACNYVNFFLLTWLPYYLVREQHFSMEGMAKLGGAAYVTCAGVAAVSGKLSDRWLTSGASPTMVRKSFTAGGLSLCGIALGFCGVVGPNTAAVLLIVAMVFFGVSSSNLWAIPQRLAGPHAAGRWVGFQNGFGNLAGVLAPMLTGFAVNQTGQFYWAFIILTAVAIAGAASWIFMVGEVEQVEWED
jgi:ACS family D-galactonate transporter-like MFS transporter